MSKICKNCGSWQDDNAKFCEECGSSLAGGGTPVMVDTEPEIMEAEIVDVIVEPPRRHGSPAADAGEVRERLVGTRQEYYLPRFEKMENLNSFTSWNWCAFLFSGSWMMYRKMYVFGVVFWVLGELVSWLELGALRWVLWIAAGVLGNFLYMKDINARTEKALNMQPEQREIYIQKNSGTGWAAVVILIAVSFLLARLF